MSERKTWVIPKNRWHAKIYCAWRALGVFKSTSNYRENLCHYWRVVVFWAPVTVFSNWFFLGRTPSNSRNNNDDVPPILWVLVVGIPLALIIGAYASMTWWGATLSLIGVPAVLVGAGFLIGFLIEKWEDRRRSARWQEKPEPQPNMFIEVLKAKKHRVCPLIEIENGD